MDLGPYPPPVASPFLVTPLIPVIGHSSLADTTTRQRLYTPRHWPHPVCSGSVWFQLAPSGTCTGSSNLTTPTDHPKNHVRHNKWKKLCSRIKKVSHHNFMGRKLWNITACYATELIKYSLYMFTLTFCTKYFRYRFSSPESWKPQICSKSKQVSDLTNLR